MRLPLLARLTVALPLALALGAHARPARACTPPQGIPAGEAVVRSTLPSVPRDAGILFEVEFDMDPASVIDWLAPAATRGGAPLEGTFRLLDHAAWAGGRRGRVLFMPREALATGDVVSLSIRAPSQPRRSEDEAPTPTRETATFQVTDARVADLDLARATLASTSTSLRSDESGPMGRCELASPQVSGNSCGAGGGAPLKDVAFAMRAVRGHDVVLTMPFGWTDDALRLYTSLEVTSDFDASLARSKTWNRTLTSFAPRSGRTCVSVKLSLAGELTPPRTREVCTDLPALSEVTPEEHAAERVRVLSGYECASVVYPNGETGTQESVGETRAEDGAGCSAAPTRTRSSGAVGLMGALLGLSLVLRRRRSRG